jgi:hypothetical protein
MGARRAGAAYQQPGKLGAADPKYYLLGFSKGETQNKAMIEVKAKRASFEDVPFKGMRKRLGWLLRALGLIGSAESVDGLFRSSESRFQMASLIRCSISARNAGGGYSYKLKDILDADGQSDGNVRAVMLRCARKHLSGIKAGTSFVMLGLDQEQIKWTKEAFEAVYGPVSVPKPTAYRSDGLSWVHVAHPSGSQTDPQYERWCNGTTSVPKVLWARDELAYRNKIRGS